MQAAETLLGWVSGDWVSGCLGGEGRVYQDSRHLGSRRDSRRDDRETAPLRL